jgi:hypothetical protein
MSRVKILGHAISQRFLEDNLVWKKKMEFYPHPSYTPFEFAITDDGECIEYIS